jgi:hypothetical protein
MMKWPGVALVLGLSFSLLTVASAARSNQPAGVWARSRLPYSLQVWSHTKVTGTVNEVSGELTGIRNYPAVGTIGVDRTVCSLNGWKGAVHLSELPRVGTNVTLVCQGYSVSSITPAAQPPDASARSPQQKIWWSSGTTGSHAKTGTIHISGTVAAIGSTGITVRGATCPVGEVLDPGSLSTTGVPMFGQAVVVLQAFRALQVGDQARMSCTAFSDGHSNGSISFIANA